jgi:hypothetical protein
LYVQEYVCLRSCKGERQLAAKFGPEATWYVQERLGHIDDDDLHVAGEDQEDKDWRIGADVGEGEMDFDGPESYIGDLSGSVSTESRTPGNDQGPFPSCCKV